MKIIIDRFEGEYAVVELEDKQIINMPKKLLPSEAKEGSVISIIVDYKETDKRRKRIVGLMNQLWKD